VASPVFKTMFSKKHEPDSSGEFELPEKKLKYVIKMLDYLYPETKTHFSGKFIYLLLN